ncbi:MAG TPA: hypothetical protein VD966_08090 [Pyrinomonadaceae bacterium]|nr:hypothetical protein [Pyrinomonadaceae bacterium]
MRFFQTKAARLQTAEQCFDLPPLGIIGEYLVSFRAAGHNHIFALWGAHPYQRNLCFLDSPPATEQVAHPSPVCAKQISSRDHFVTTSIRDFQILFEAQAEGNLLSPQIPKPIPANEFALGGHK